MIQKKFNNSYSIIIFATNKMTYVDFALNLAKSILLRNNIKIFIVSNLSFSIPDQLSDYVNIIPAKAEHTQLGIGMKLYIDEYLQTEHTLFIDSDCLCYGDLDTIFKACETKDVTVAGNMVPVENWCGVAFAKSIKENYGLDEIIRFNGGLYYLKNTPLTKNIFDKAREIGEKHDYGFDSIKNKWVTEEPLIAIAMILYQQQPIADNGCYMTDLYTDYRPIKLNVLTGKNLLKNKPHSHERCRPWYPTKYSPIILHFGGKNINSYPYKSQGLLLKLNNLSIAIPVASTLVCIFIDIPYKTYHYIKDLLRNKRWHKQ